MTRKRGAVAGGALLAVLALALNVLPSSAQTPPPPIAAARNRLWASCNRTATGALQGCSNRPKEGP